MKVIAGPSGPVMPDEPLVFEVELTNQGNSPSSFQLFTDHRFNVGLLTHLLNGDTLTAPQQYDRIDAGETITTTVMLTRGPVLYDYPSIPLIFRSACEGARNIGDGNLIAILPDGIAQSEADLFNVALENNSSRIQFAEPCPRVEFSGDLALDQSFLVNLESQEESLDKLRVLVRNLEASQRSLAENKADPLGRIERVDLLFRRIGTGPWQKAREKESGEEIDFTQLDEDNFGFIGVDWKLDQLSDGEYELVVKSVCEATPGAPQGFNQNFSERITGVIDRKEPALFGFPQPRDGELHPGEAVTFEFIEDLLCGPVDVFEIQVTIDGVADTFNNALSNTLLTTCQGRIISFQFKDLARFDEFMGKTATITLSHVKDLHGNVLSNPIRHHVTFATIEIAESEMSLTMSIGESRCDFEDTIEQGSYQFSSADIEAFKTEVGGTLNVDPSRITIELVRCVQKGIAEIRLFLSPNEDTGSRRLSSNQLHPSTTPSTFEIARRLQAMTNIADSKILDVQHIQVWSPKTVTKLHEHPPMVVSEPMMQSAASPSFHSASIPVGQDLYFDHDRHPESFVEGFRSFEMTLIALVVVLAVSQVLLAVFLLRGVRKTDLYSSPVSSFPETEYNRKRASLTEKRLSLSEKGY